MKSLNITNVADLQTVPMLKLLSMTRPGAIGMPWFLGPVVDGKTLPEHVFDPKATPISENVPLLTGSTETELTWNAQQQYDPLDDAALRANLSQSLRISPERADTVAAIYKKNRPMASNLDVYLIAISDNSGFRTGTDTQALRKAELGKAAVYKYYFQKYSPVRDGMLRSMHTMDIPFAFDNVAVAKTEIGSGADLQPLADKMSTAWVAFARTGNPNHKGIPNWPVYTPSQRATMILNVECKVVNDPFREEKDSIAAAQKA
jgi:para-nitrobenzyl esterase